MSQCTYATNGTAKPRTIRRHNAKQCRCYGVIRTENRNPKTTPATPAPTVDTIEQGDQDGSNAFSAMADTAWGLKEWRTFIQAKGQDPDKVTFQYGVTSNPHGGYWNKLWNVRQIPEVLTVDNLIDYEAAHKRLAAYKLPRRTPGTGLGEPVAAVLNLADMQLHKPDGDGLKGTLDRLTDGLENFETYCARQRAGGRNIDELVMVNNGDPFEGVSGNYANQAHTVHTGLREQMNTVLDVWETYSRELFPQFDKGRFVTVHCNHTQFGRQGGAKDSLTGDADTGSAFLAEALRRILRGRSEFDHVQFTIPDDQMNVYATAAGVPLGFNHGHKIPGTGADGFEKWLNGQVRGDRLAYEARVWITAHKHSLQFFDLGSASVFQCPSCDGGSKWLRDTSGRYSQSGILALLVGNHNTAGWSDPALI